MLIRIIDLPRIEPPDFKPPRPPLLPPTPPKPPLLPPPTPPKPPLLPLPDPKPPIFPRPAPTPVDEPITSIPNPKPKPFKGTTDTSSLDILGKEDWSRQKDENPEYSEYSSYDEYYQDALVRAAAKLAPNVQTDERDSELISSMVFSNLFMGNNDNNVFIDSSGNTTFYGNAGIDTVIYSGEYDDYEVNKISASSFSVSSNTEKDILNGIERIEFQDIKLALDLDGNAGIVAKVYGAVFGDEFFSLDKELITTGLNMLDNGLSYENFATAALLARGYNNDSSIEEIVSMLYTNVVGFEPTTEQAKPFVDMFNNGEKSETDLVKLAAEFHLNEENIDFVGLSAHGLIYA